MYRFCRPPAAVLGCEPPPGSTVAHGVTLVPCGPPRGYWLPAWEAERRPCRYPAGAEYDRERVYQGQHRGNPLRLGISIKGAAQLLQVLHWDWYDVVQRHKPLFYRPTADLRWNTGPKNGYDLCDVVIPAFLDKIGVPHLSLLEAILDGTAEELRPLRPEVGPADVFVAHVRQLPLDALLQSLRDGELAHRAELTADREETRRRRRARLRDFFCDAGAPQSDEDIDALSERLPDAADLREFLELVFQRAPDLTGLHAPKAPDEPVRYFIDYFGLRQGLGRLIEGADAEGFDLPQVQRAIAETGLTMAALDDDLRFLKRTFCVFEAFETVRHNGRLLVCGPAVEGRGRALRVAGRAADARQRGALMGSGSARCGREGHKRQIDRCLGDSVGFDRVDAAVLAGVARGCMGRARAGPESAPAGDADATADAMYRLADVLLEGEALPEAWLWAQRGLGLRESTHGPEALATAAHLRQVAWISHTAGLGPGEQHERWYRRALQIYDSAHARAEAGRCLVGMAALHNARGRSHPLGSDSVYGVGLQCQSYGEAVGCASRALDALAAAFGDDAVEVAAALEQLHGAHVGLDKWMEAEACGERWLRVLEAHYGEDAPVSAMADAFAGLGDYHFARGDYEQGLQRLQKALEIRVQATGKWAPCAGRTCYAIAGAYGKLGRWDEAVPFYERAAEALEFACGAKHNQTREARVSLGVAEGARGIQRIQQEMMGGSCTGALDVKKLELAREVQRLNRSIEEAAKALEHLRRHPNCIRLPPFGQIRGSSEPST